LTQAQVNHVTAQFLGQFGHQLAFANAGRTPQEHWTLNLECL
jgi:hypothetical protein